MENALAQHAEDLVAHRGSLIASYKRPRSIDVRDSVPRPGAGKISRSELRKAFWKEGGRHVA